MNKRYDKIEEAGKKSPFKVPEGYFEGLTDQIMDRLSEVEVEQPKIPSAWDRMKPWIYMAAMFVGIALIFKMFNGDSNQTDKLTVSNNIQQKLPVSFNEREIDEDVYDYLESEAIRSNYREAVFIGEY